MNNILWEKLKENRDNSGRSFFETISVTNNDVMYKPVYVPYENKLFFYKVGDDEFTPINFVCVSLNKATELVKLFAEWDE